MTDQEMSKHIKKLLFSGGSYLYCSPFTVIEFFTNIVCYRHVQYKNSIVITALSTDALIDLQFDLRISTGTEP